jgi:hypothetical protein
MNGTWPLHGPIQQRGQIDKRGLEVENKRLQESRRKMIEKLFVEAVVRNRCCLPDMLPKIEAALFMTVNMAQLALCTYF